MRLSSCAIGCLSLPLLTLATSIAFAQGGGQIWVTDDNDNQVVLIDTASNTLLDTISTGAGSLPCNLGVTRDQKTVYVADCGNSSISVIDVASRAVEKTWDLPAAGGFAVSPDGSVLYVSTYSGTYYPSPWGTGILAIDTATGQVLWSYDFSQSYPDVSYANYPTLSPDGAHIYVGFALNGTSANPFPSYEAMISTTTHLMERTAPLPASVGGTHISKDGLRIYATSYNFGIGSLAVLSAADLSAIATIATDEPSSDMIQTPDGERGWVFNDSSPGTISVVDLVGNTVATTIGSGGTAPGGIAFNPDGSVGYTNNAENIAAISTSNYQILQTFTGYTNLDFGNDATVIPGLVQAAFGGFSAPLASKNAKSFAAGATIQVKFSLVTPDGLSASVPGPAYLSITQAGKLLPVGSANAKGTANQFVYNAKKNEFQFDLSTSGYAPGEYVLTAFGSQFLPQRVTFRIY